MSRILLVGCGKMGSALLEGWLDRGQEPAEILVVEPGGVQAPGQVRVVADAAAIPEAFAPDIVVLAVKPQVMGDILPAYRHHAGRAAFLSIAAGKTTRSFEDILGQDAAIVRAMPNTPALVGQGMTGLYARPEVSADERAAVQAMVEPTGPWLWVDREADLDAVTALSGSGPAYVFYFIEAMMQAAQDMGLSAEQGRQLAQATFAGATALASQSPDSPATLRERVTSKGGTTYAALSHLEQAGVKAAFIEAMRAAQRRAGELGDEFGR